MSFRFMPPHPLGILPLEVGLKIVVVDNVRVNSSLYVEVEISEIVLLSPHLPIKIPILAFIVNYA